MKNFKGLNTLSKSLTVIFLYRYMYGNTDSIFRALFWRAMQNAKGYTHLFI